MKKIVVFLLFFFVPSLVFAEDVECTLDQYVAGDAAYKATCNILDINTTTNIGNLGSEALTFKDVEINNVTIEDLTFLNNVTADRFIVINSKINLDNLMLKSKIAFFRATYIVDDDLSGLANNTILENLTFDNCWLNTLETITELKNISTLNTLTITANRYLHLNFEPIMELPNLTTVNLNYMQHHISAELGNFLESKGVVVPGYPVTAMKTYHFNDGYPLTDYDLIRELTLMVVEDYTIVDTTRTVKSFFEAYKNGEATQVELALILSDFLQNEDFKTAHILGHESGATTSSSIYVMVYFNNRWNVIDIVGLKNDPDAVEALKNGEETDLFMQDANTKFSGGAALDEKLIDYMDYSFHIGYVLPAGQARIQILPLDLTTYSLLEGNVEGYTFHGWYLDESYMEPFTNDDEINKNLVLYGKFEEVLAPPITDGSDGNQVVPPDTGMFMGLWIVLPIVALVAIEWFRNKRFNSMGGI